MIFMWAMVSTAPPGKMITYAQFGYLSKLLAMSSLLNLALYGLSVYDNQIFNYIAGYIDETGKMVIPAIWSDAWGFNEQGFACVEK